MAAEELLLKEIEPEPKSGRAASLLAYLGSIYFLNHDYLNAAIALKKSDAITPLPPGPQFSLAMAYIRIAHREWARPVLESLSAHDSKKPSTHIGSGGSITTHNIIRKRSTAFSRPSPSILRWPVPTTALACATSIKTRPNRRSRISKQPSPWIGGTASLPWPYINLATTLEFLGRPQEAEAALRQALQLDPKLAAAHYQLGNVLQHQGRLEAAVPEMQEAIRLDDNYAEPHIALAHIYKRLGEARCGQRRGQNLPSFAASANGRASVESKANRTRQ